jgi:hypothetical protein
VAAAHAPTRSGLKNWFQGVRMILHPFLMSLPGVILWHFVYTRGMGMSIESAEPIINDVKPFVSIGHFFFVTALLTYQLSKLEKVAAACPHNGDIGDKPEFLRLVRSLALPLPLQTIVFCTATAVELWTIALHYGSYASGLGAVFTVGFILSLAWEGLADSVNPFAGMWVVKDPPEEWRREAELTLKPRISDLVYEWLYRQFTVIGVAK